MSGTSAGGGADGAPAASARLPIFPLALVLFPGAQLPLHIFEPRYRAMLADVRAADGRFGIVLRTTNDERAIPAGFVGCTALVREAVPLADGRSNVLVEGVERFAVDRLVDAGTPYHVAAIRAFRDEPVRDADALAAATARVRAAFRRVADAARTLADDPPEAEPALPDDDTDVAFAVAAAVELDLAVRQRVLASRDALERTSYLARILEQVVPEIEHRATVHVRARSNGHGPHHPPSASA